LQPQLREDFATVKARRFNEVKLFVMTSFWLQIKVTYHAQWKSQARR